MQSPCSIGIDIGGTTCELALVDERGRVSASESHVTGQFKGYRELLTYMGRRAAVLAASARPPVTAVGVGIPGPVREDGTVLFAPNLPGRWRNVDVQGIVSRASRWPVYPLNDANAAAFGEYRFGAGRGASTMVLYTLGTGIGGGIVLDGKLLIGARGRAAELGHATIMMGGPRCGCGNHGCVEALTAIPALLRRTHEKLATGRASTLVRLVRGNLNEINRERIGLLLAKAARQRDPVALEVIAETAAALGAAIASTVMMLDPDRIILGGGIAKIGAPLINPIRRAVAERTAAIGFDPKTIVPARLANAGLVGAAAWAREQASNPRAQR